MDNKLSEEKLASLSPTERRMATENLKKLIFLYSIPTVISMFINALYNVVDRFWVGQIPDVGKAALAGVGLTAPIMIFELGGAMLVGIGSAACISIRLGKGDKEGAERVLGNAMTLSLLIGVLLTVVGLAFKTPLLRAIGASNATMPFADEYITIILQGSIFQVLSFAMNHPIRAAGNPKRFASTQMVGAISNMILDPIFILVFKMGVQGAAIATILSMFISAAWIFIYYFSGNSLLKLRRAYLKLKKETVSAIMSIGFSPCLMQVAASLVGFLVNRQLKFYGDLELGNGDTAIGAMTVINGVMMLALMPVFGINQGSQPIIGYNYGARNYKRVREAYTWNAIYAVSVSVVFCVLVEIFAPQIVRSFNDSPDLIAVGTFGMRLMMCTVAFVGFQAATVNFFTAIGRAKMSVFLSLLRQVIVLIPAYIVFPIFFDMTGIWFAQPFADIFATLTTAYFITREMRLLKITMAEG